MPKAQDTSGKLHMPLATAVWLIDNTALTFTQIANFTSLSEIEIQGIANGEIGKGLVGRNPVEYNELTQEELDRCSEDENAALKMKKSDLPAPKMRSKGPRYTPVSKRGDKPDAIAYILKNNPEISDAQITKLVGTTKPTIEAVRDRTHPNTPNLKPRHPADLGLCNYQEYDNAVSKGLKAAGKDPEKVKAEREAQKAAELASQDREEDAHGAFGGFDFSNFMSSSSSSSESNTETQNIPEEQSQTQDSAEDISDENTDTQAFIEGEDFNPFENEGEEKSHG